MLNKLVTKETQQRSCSKKKAQGSIAVEQWYSTWGKRTLGGMRKHLTDPLEP
jgi:hypothetical protein